MIAQQINPYNSLSWTHEMLQHHAAKFRSAFKNNHVYRGDIQWVFSKIREAVIFMVSEIRFTTNFGSDFKKIQTEDELEAWIIEHIFPRMEKEGWQAPGTAEFMELIHKLKVEIMNIDAAVITIRNQMGAQP